MPRKDNQIAEDDKGKLKGKLKNKLTLTLTKFEFKNSSDKITSLRFLSGENKIWEITDSRHLIRGSWLMLVTCSSYFNNGTIRFRNYRLEFPALCIHGSRCHLLNILQ